MITKFLTRMCMFFGAAFLATVLFCVGYVVLVSVVNVISGCWFGIKDPYSVTLAGTMLPKYRAGWLAAECITHYASYGVAIIFVVARVLDSLLDKEKQ